MVKVGGGLSVQFSRVAHERVEPWVTRMSQHIHQVCFCPSRARPRVVWEQWQNRETADQVMRRCTASGTWPHRTLGVEVEKMPACYDSRHLTQYVFYIAGWDTKSRAFIQKHRQIFWQVSANVPVILRVSQISSGDGQEGSFIGRKQRYVKSCCQCMCHKFS